MVKKLLAALVAAPVMIVLALASPSVAAGGGGSSGPPAGHGGGNGGRPTTEIGNNLSVPAVFVPSSATFSTLRCDGLPTPPSGETTTFPTGFTKPLPLDPSLYGEYYVQGEDTWQAGCTTAAVGTIAATVDWGDNLTGDAKLKVGSPVRVEVGLFHPTPAVLHLTGYDTIKLTDELDRYATYGTRGVASAPYTTAMGPEVRVWASDARFEIVGPSPVALQSMTAEINATGRVVYGYNWRPSEPGAYTVHFVAPSVGVDSSIQVTVVASRTTR